MRYRFLFIPAFLFLLFSIRAQQPQGEGYLGLTFTPTLETGGLLQSPRARLPLTVEGGSIDWEIFTRITLLSDMLRIGNQFGNDASFLQPGEEYLFSFLNLQVDYIAYTFKELRFTGGFGMGHRGFLSSASSNLKYSIYGSLRAGVLWFFAEKWMLATSVELPLPVYSHNIKNLLFGIADLHITFDPIGPVLNPLPDSALYSLGIETEVFRYTENNRRQGTFIRPYLKASILY